MAFKQVTDLSADKTISLGGYNKKLKKDNPTSVEGYYLGSRTVADKKKKDGLSYIYFLQTSEGNVGVWGKTDIDRKMRTVTPGVLVRLSFSHMVDTPNGEMYKYKVEFDESDVIEVSQETENTGSSETSDDSEESTDDDTEAQQDYGLKGSAAERKSKVESLLNKKK